ncbi:EPIDERMAL PATTERNING FACTOR-like protein 9 [Alnus glutinosa]|uniref:EPIDERMAL PATTERNING FACTOR-like protein 9 n=1 Tax=Alnus glutinosa TaxID=3517 RepID=UPI002D797718|nr:EPIDERMAL PATTERNING FACTOR-like protein 9 [Alnus glutinosa]
MSNIKLCNLLLLFVTLIVAAYVIQGCRKQSEVDGRPRVFHPSRAQKEIYLQGGNERMMTRRNSRRLMIGSTAPTCTYNECRGCKYRCRAEQVPVEGNDPINSAYHYRCVCHR